MKCVCMCVWICVHGCVHARMCVYGGRFSNRTCREIRLPYFTEASRMLKPVEPVS